MHIDDMTKAPKSPTFNDSDLEKLLTASTKRKSTGVIYTWSPQIIFSLPEAKQAQSVLNSLHGELTLLLDPYAPATSAKTAARANGLPESALKRLQSELLFERGMLDHYPSFIVYSNGRLIGQARLGHVTPEELKAFVQNQTRGQK